MKRVKETTCTPSFWRGIFGGTLPKTKISLLKVTGHTKRKTIVFPASKFQGGVVCRFGWTAARSVHENRVQFVEPFRKNISSPKNAGKDKAERESKDP